MSKILDVKDDIVQIGTDDGGIKEVRRVDVKFDAKPGDKVDIFENENSVIVTKKEDETKKEEISDVIQWNKKHGIIWLTYGICIELGFWLGFVMPVEVLEMVFMMGGVIIPLPFMVIRHRKLEKEYKLK